MTKKEREQIRNKFSNRCYLCGCQLGKSFHIDHIEPVGRRRKYIPGHYEDKDGNHVYVNMTGDLKYVQGKYILDGYDYPDRLVTSNLNPACASCNINKHQMSIEQFREQIKGFLNHLNNHSTQYKLSRRYGLVEQTDKPVVFYFETLQDPLVIQDEDLGVAIYSLTSP